MTTPIQPPPDDSRTKAPDMPLAASPLAAIQWLAANGELPAHLDDLAALLADVLG